MGLLFCRRAKARTTPHTPTPLPAQGLPEDAREGELQALLAPVGGLREVRLPRDRDSGRPKGYAFLVRPAGAGRVWCGSEMRTALRAAQASALRARQGVVA